MKKELTKLVAVILGITAMGAQTTYSKDMSANRGLLDAKSSASGDPNAPTPEHDSGSSASSSVEAPKKPDYVFQQFRAFNNKLLPVYIVTISVAMS